MNPMTAPTSALITIGIGNGAQDSGATMAVV